MIVLKDIVKEYKCAGGGNVTALDHVDLTVNDGEMLAIMGVSGSGKSTLLHIIGCIDKSTSGSYELDGEMISRFYSDTLCRIRNEKMGLILQDYGLIEDRTVFENVMIPLVFSKTVSFRQMKMKARSIIDEIGIASLSDKKVRELSGGQKQRVAIARALVNEPSVILADEPTSALDKKTAMEIMDTLENTNQKRNCTVIIVTHDQRVADRCRRTLYLTDGKIEDQKK